MKILIGDILQSKVQTIVNTINCVGVMGKGIALEFKNKFPEMYEDYLQRCQRGEVRPGIPYLYRSLLSPQIINFPTKDHWKSVSKISDIDRGLAYLQRHYQEWGVTSLAIPPLGCGNGQLEWRQVGPLIYRYTRQMDIPIELYAPYGTHPQELTTAFLGTGGMEPSVRTVSMEGAAREAWIALVEILDRIDKQPYHWAVGRTIFQKIAYVATREGLPTGLTYEKGSYGPFSKNLKPMEAYLVNNNLLQEERMGRMFIVKVGPRFSRVRGQYTEVLERWKPVIDKTTDLFMRTDTDRAEIVATVIYAAQELKERKHSSPTETEILKAVMLWKQKRRPPLKKDEVASAVRHLAMLGFIDAIADAKLPEDALAV